MPYGPARAKLFLRCDGALGETGKRLSELAVGWSSAMGLRRACGVFLAEMPHGADATWRAQLFMHEAYWIGLARCSQ